MHVSHMVRTRLTLLGLPWPGSDQDVARLAVEGPQLDPAVAYLLHAGVVSASTSRGLE